MNRLTLLTPLFFAVLCLPMLAAGLPRPAGKTQSLTSPDQVPEGLDKSGWQSIRAAYEAGRHSFQPTTNGWQARNPGQQWLTTFDPRGFVAQPRDGGWQWGLEFRSYGFAGAERPISGVPSTQAEGQRLTYGWDTTIREWFVNSPAGLEHGFTLTERPATSPAGGEPGTSLQFALAVRGTLVAQVTADGLGVEFRDAAGATVLNYAGLKVWDADGKILSSHFAPSDLRHPSLVVLLVDEAGARYPLTIDPTAQQAYLKPARVGPTQFDDHFGFSVAVSGDTVVVGAPGEDGSGTTVNAFPDESANGAGAAYVFVRSGTTWTQQAYLKPAAVGTTQAGDQFGFSVAVSGDTVVVGANAEDSSTTGVNSTPNESASNAGAAYVFVRSGTTWTQQAYLKPAAVGTAQVSDFFGGSVAVSGDTVVIGAAGEDSSSTGVNSVPDESAGDAGAAYVFVRSGTTWTQQAYLKPAAIGTAQAADGFGVSVAASGDTVVVGAYAEDSGTTGVNSTPDESANNAGAAYVFVRSGTTWSQQAYLKASNTGANDKFGSAVAVADETAVVGAPIEASNTTGVNG
ncbi:MAG TPA: FG-GAP repeat protein, partial [Candidatus Limnocylindria bacterium]|nr:FG-GAP repeat protein [Candidatus Limnocylindria bacterium]